MINYIGVKGGLAAEVADRKLAIAGEKVSAAASVLSVKGDQEALDKATTDVVMADRAAVAVDLIKTVADSVLTELGADAKVRVSGVWSENGFHMSIVRIF